VTMHAAVTLPQYNRLRGMARHGQESSWYDPVLRRLPSAVCKRRLVVSLLTWAYLFVVVAAVRLADLGRREEEWVSTLRLRCEC
jgi:hypothetical protein